ncbi:carboxymuconolactone decarboxylase family protein [Paraglaciecola hydrolytica]|uniref:Carboxymuconolactone decarboxylase-like domain-containing protein n=1 Tax=Paraglaciecola hydrolytica TaxID=1799789 RepID=A0A136A753_9ALTE|nr:carboxymuconolactone decarboxylase family protein [Paraglaciecola hydrolytica]KXI30960.1 hypothetical protein AX660_00400 [Paraglaciecola hydrolytica]
MTNFDYHTPETASDVAASILSNIQDNVGFIPNIFALVAESECALQGLVALNSAFNASSFSAQEQQIILLATSTTNECVYCVAGHTAFSQNLDISNKIIKDMRDQQPTEIESFNVLANTVRQLIQGKGRVSSELIKHFFNAGFSKAQFLELVMGICVKTFTNYVSNSLSVELDDAFKPYTWQRPSDTRQQVA